LGGVNGRSTSASGRWIRVGGGSMPSSRRRLGSIATGASAGDASAPRLKPNGARAPIAHGGSPAAWAGSTGGASDAGTAGGCPGVEAGAGAGDTAGPRDSTDPDGTGGGPGGAVRGPPGSTLGIARGTAGGSARRRPSPAGSDSGGCGSRRCAAGPGDSATARPRIASSGGGGSPVAVSRIDDGSDDGAEAAGARRLACPAASGAKPADVTITPGWTGATPDGGPAIGAAATGAATAAGAAGAPAGAAGAGAPAWLDEPSGGGFVVPVLRSGGAAWLVPARGGSCTPVAGALRARRGGSGGNRLPHD
jgi:hypothetical protein